MDAMENPRASSDSTDAARWKVACARVGLDWQKAHVNELYDAVVQEWLTAAFPSSLSCQINEEAA